MFKKVVLPLLVLSAIAGVRYFMTGRSAEKRVPPDSVAPADGFTKYAIAETVGGI